MYIPSTLGWWLATRTAYGWIDSRHVASALTHTWIWRLHRFGEQHYSQSDCELRT